MQQRSGTSPPAVAEPSRRRPPRQRVADPIPIPVGPSRRRPRSVQDVLSAHQRAIEERLGDGLLRIQETVAQAARTAAAEAVSEAGATTAPSALGRDAEDVSRALLMHAEERFQALGIRLQRIEDALTALAARGGRDWPELDRLAALLREVGRRQGAAMAQLARAHHAAIERLAEHQREVLEDLGKRTGRGVVAVARELRRALDEDLDGVRASIRSIHRTLAWEEMAPGRAEPQAPASSA